ncbi:hypothetical protein FA15DRAFT_664711 [Coprinopsis marcescibilis]|uniref:Transcription initiation factor TFIID subunit 4 n=1 Tax=Coprinopsis marcescibilis TaxID=230819 RepID=A0A5C3L8B4_COPMA|nr:hypothetical protein FA15DRAFT_664711 [Coprinopsis marcescibilis]
MPPKDQATSMTTPITPVSTTTGTPVQMTAATTITAGTPVPTYPSPAHAQWAATGQIPIDPALQQQSTPQTPQNAAATTVAAPKPTHTTITPATATSAQAAAVQAYYSAFTQHYPHNYAQHYQQYMAAAISQAAQAQHSQQHTPAHSNAQAHTPTPIATPHRTSFSTATPTATTASTPVPTSHTPTATNIITPATATTITPATATTAMGSTAANNANQLDTSDVATLNDALGVAGVDLRAEEESLQRHDTHNTGYMQHGSLYMQNRPYEDRSRKQPIKPAFDARALGTTMRAIGTQHKVTKVPEDSVNYLALAVRARLQDLVTAMIKASKYRKESQYDRPVSFYETIANGGDGMDIDGIKREHDTQTPMWSVIVRNNIAKQLLVLERVEREEEMKIRKERKERSEMAAAHNAVLQAQAAGANGSDALAAAGGSEDADGQPKKKKKKEGPGVTARNMSEDVRKKMSNAVATQAAGLGKYAWMTAANANSATPSKKAGTPAAGSSGGASGGGTWARPYVPKKTTQPIAGVTSTTSTTESQKSETEDNGRVVVTLRDAMFVVEKERGHGGGRGSARGWT